MTMLTPPAPKPQTKVQIDDHLRHVQDNFIRKWGEMGQVWGINRTMAEIHALLYVAAQPQCTDDVMDACTSAAATRA